MDNQNDSHDPFFLDKKNYQLQWDQIQYAWVSERMPHAIIFVGAFDRNFNVFIKKLTQLILCDRKGAEPCFKCADCQMAARGEHPDMNWIKPEKKGGPIKIDQVRELQNCCYLTPQRAQHRLVVIEAADRMNTASANSLLKILEEPPSHILFFLIAQQLSTVLPTVLSRCQIIRFASYDLSMMNVLLLGDQYLEESEQGLIIKKSEDILNGLLAVMEHKEHPCVVAAQWNQFEFGALIWFLYLVYAQIQMMQINTIVPTMGPAIHQLERLSSLLNPILIFSQIDKLNALQRKLSHNININQILALEDLLLSIDESRLFS